MLFFSKQYTICKHSFDILIHGILRSLELLHKVQLMEDWETIIFWWLLIHSWQLAFDLLHHICSYNDARLCLETLLPLILNFGSALNNKMGKGRCVKKFQKLFFKGKYKSEHGHK